MYCDISGLVFTDMAWCRCSRNEIGATVFLSQSDISNSYRVSHYLPATMLNEQQKGMLTEFLYLGAQASEKELWGQAVKAYSESV